MLNKKEIHRLTARLTARLLIQLIVSEIIYLFVLWGGLFLGMVVSNTVIWQSWNPIYQFLHFIEENIIIFMAAITVCGMVWIFIHYWKKTMNYVEQLIEASQVLVDCKEDTQIYLPDDLNTVEMWMNQMKQNLLRSQRAAKESEKRKNDLVVYLAHDLKTPLTSVIGYLSLMEEQSQIDEALRMKYMKIARNKAERLEDLINEFFEITRFNLTELELESSTVDLSFMLEQIVWEFKPSASLKNLDFDLSIQKAIKAELDVNKMERVFDNLIRNAISYSYENTSIKIQAEVINTKIRIIIENEGKTIPADKLSRLFEQFFRLDSSRGTKTGGSGVGLAIAKEIIELHQGTLKAESAKEKIRFIIEIPQNL